MIVHTAVRTKVPLKKKVRGERSTKKHHSQMQQQQQSTKQSAPLPPLPHKENVLPNTSTNAATSPINPIPAIKISKHLRKASDSPRKLLKKKKKRSMGSDDVGNKKDQELIVPVKPTRKLKKKSKHKEVIDYSNPELHTNTFGKVQKWLLESPIVSSAASQIEHASKITNIMNKSQSTPEQLVLAQRSPSNTKIKTKSATNLNEKVRLQVVYKPPFKFSLKLSKNDQSVKTNVVGVDKNKHSKGRLDRKRIQTAIAEEPQRPRRTALLIRSATEEMAQLTNEFNDEPNYETLNSKLNPPQHQRQQSLTMDPNYENIQTSQINLMDNSLSSSTTSPVINTATFRINKSASGNNIQNRSLPVIATPVMTNRSRHSHKGSHQNLTGTNGSGGSRERRSSIENSNSNLAKFSGSTQNLVRSSTTNLAKIAAGSHRQSGDIKRRASDMNRSSTTTNLNKYNRQHSHHSSNSNLKRGGSNLDINGANGDNEYYGVNSAERKSRKNSVNLGSKSSNSANIPRTYSNSNLIANTGTSSGGKNSSSSRRDSFSNIPRASLINSNNPTNSSSNNNNSSSNNNFQRQTSLNVKPSTSTSSTRRMMDEMNQKRPQTSSCDNSMKHFEWPKALSTAQRPLPDDILPSDLEVMCSDVENLVSDR